MLHERGLETVLGEFPRAEGARKKASLIAGGLEPDEPGPIQFRALKAHACSCVESAGRHTVCTRLSRRVIASHS